MKNTIHSLADVQSENIGMGNRIWQFVVVLKEAVIGNACNICSHVFIENDVQIGDQVTVKNGVRIYDGATIEDGVFIGPNVVFTNDKHPRSQREFQLKRVHIKKGASIGAGSVLVGPLTIGKNAMIGAGSLVTKDIPDGVLALGSPARVVREIATDESSSS